MARYPRPHEAPPPPGHTLADYDRKFSEFLDQTQDPEPAVVADQLLSCLLALICELELEGIIDWKGLRSVHELQKALKLVQAGKKPRLFYPDTPGKPRGLTARSLIEAEAAAVFERARELGLRGWSAKIKQVLDEARFHRPRTVGRSGGPYTADSIRKWCEACLAGKHEMSAHFEQKLSYWRHYDISIDMAVASLDMAVASLRRRLEQKW